MRLSAVTLCPRTKLEPMVESDPNTSVLIRQPASLALQIAGVQFLQLLSTALLILTPSTQRKLVACRCCGCIQNTSSLQLRFHCQSQNVSWTCLHPTPNPFVETPPSPFYLPVHFFKILLKVSSKHVELGASLNYVIQLLLLGFDTLYVNI